MYSQRFTFGPALAAFGLAAACTDISVPSAPSVPVAEGARTNSSSNRKHVLDITGSPFGCGVSRHTGIGVVQYAYTNIRFHGKEFAPSSTVSPVKLRLSFGGTREQPEAVAICTVPNTPEAISSALAHLVVRGAAARAVGPIPTGQSVLPTMMRIPVGKVFADDLPPVVATAPWTYYDYGEFAGAESGFYGPFDASVGDGGGGSSPFYDPEGDVEDCSVDSATVPILPMQSLPGESVTNFDCWKVQCPSGMVILNNPAVVKAAKDLLRQMQNDPNHVERGAWIFMNSVGDIGVGIVNADGSVTLGRGYVGTNVCNYGISCMPQLSLEPAVNPGYYIIGILHTHPLVAGPSGPDANNAIFNHDYSIVTTAKNSYELGPNGAALYQCATRSLGACRAP